jgi:acyl carrier protein
VRRQELDVISFVPSTLRSLTDVTPPGTMDCLAQVWLGSETLYYRDVRNARPLFGPSTTLRNSFGSTEAGAIASCEVPPEDDGREGPVPVGVVEPDVEVRIVDEDDAPVADGEIGRMVVVRRGRVALGYWNDPELTRQHFFDEPDGRRGFRSPDSCQWRSDGLLEHVGRLDSRVKVHGAMVATSEVEVALTSHPDVADAAVVAVPDEHGTRLVAYVVARDGAPLSAWKLRRDLSARLSSTSLPGTFVALEALPRTVRDKVDRASLPPPPPAVRPRPYRQPVRAQGHLASIFASVLGVERVGLDDDFFELGGDSLGAVELLAAVNEELGIDLPTTALLDAPTVAELSTRLSHRRPRNASPLVELSSGHPGAPFFCVTAAGAPAISLRALAHAMDRHDFVAIQPRGLEERARPDRTIHAAARRNVLALRQRHRSARCAVSSTRCVRHRATQGRRGHRGTRTPPRTRPVQPVLRHQLGDAERLPPGDDPRCAAPARAQRPGRAGGGAGRGGPARPRRALAVGLRLVCARHGSDHRARLPRRPRRVDPQAGC